jgi:hypothetical protein
VNGALKPAYQHFGQSGRWIWLQENRPRQTQEAGGFGTRSRCLIVNSDNTAVSLDTRSTYRASDKLGVVFASSSFLRLTPVGSGSLVPSKIGKIFGHIFSCTVKCE